MAYSSVIAAHTSAFELLATRMINVGSVMYVVYAVFVYACENKTCPASAIASWPAGIPYCCINERIVASRYLYFAAEPVEAPVTTNGGGGGPAAASVHRRRRPSDAGARDSP